MVSIKLKIFVIIFLYSFQLCSSQGRKYGLPSSRNLHELLKTHSSPQENFTNNTSVASSSVVEIKVYYETLCPGSIQFFRNQLKPIAERLSEHVKIHLIPFGFAEIKWHKSRPQFRCQHGALECFGNKLHACAAEVLRGPAQPQALRRDAQAQAVTGDAQALTGEAHAQVASGEAVRGDVQAVLYAACLMDARGYRPSWHDQTRAFQQCNTHMRLSQAQRSRIFACAAGRRGSTLLVSHGGDTRRLGPPYLPYVLVDGNPSEPYLLASICSKLQPKPDACWQHL